MDTIHAASAARHPHLPIRATTRGLQIAARKGRLFLSQSRRDLLLVSRESGESNPTPDCSTTRVRPPWLFVSNPVLFFYCAFYYFLIFHSSSHTFFSFSGVALAGLVLSPLSFHPRHCRSWRFLSFNHWSSGLCAILLFSFLSFCYSPPLSNTIDAKVRRFFLYFNLVHFRSRRPLNS